MLKYILIYLVIIQLGPYLVANTFRSFRAIAAFHLSLHLLIIIFSLFRPEPFHFRIVWNLLSRVVCAIIARRLRL
jgi:hypothetical protein